MQTLQEKEYLSLFTFHIVKIKAANKNRYLFSNLGQHITSYLERFNIIAVDKEVEVCVANGQFMIAIKRRNLSKNNGKN